MAWKTAHYRPMPASLSVSPDGKTIALCQLISPAIFQTYTMNVTEAIRRFCFAPELGLPHILA